MMPFIMGGEGRPGGNGGPANDVGRTWSLLGWQQGGEGCVPHQTTVQGQERTLKELCCSPSTKDAAASPWLGGQAGGQLGQ